MTDIKDKSQPNWLLGGFGKTIDEDQALKIAKTGGVAGFAITIGEVIGTVLNYYDFDRTTWTLVAKMDVTSLEFMINAGVALLVVLLILWMSWRTYIGKGLISPILLIGLLIFEAYNKLMGGRIGVGWIIIQLILFASLIGATRAIWHLKKATKSPNPVNEF